MARPLTPAQRTTLTHLREAGLAVGETFFAQDFFGARDAADNASRRTLTQLREAGVLGQGEPAWATNAYVVLETTYAALERCGEVA